VYLGGKLHQQAPPLEALQGQLRASKGVAAAGAAAAAAGDGGGRQQEGANVQAEGADEEQEEVGSEEGGSSGGEESDELEQQLDQGGPAKLAAITFRGLITRMARLADEQRYARQVPRAAALKFIAALSSSLGAAATAPYLRNMLRPLYRLAEPGQARAAPEEVRQLGEQVLAHLRDLVGADVLLAAYNSAREGVKKVRGGGAPALLLLWVAAAQRRCCLATCACSGAGGRRLLLLGARGREF
jgi:U3 small nucleolar RNA-associated protein 20